MPAQGHIALWMYPTAYCIKRQVEEKQRLKYMGPEANLFKIIPVIRLVNYKQIISVSSMTSQKPILVALINLTIVKNYDSINIELWRWNKLSFTIFLKLILINHVRGKKRILYFFMERITKSFSYEEVMSIEPRKEKKNHEIC